jgi:small GTP-binding protein
MSDQSYVKIAMAGAINSGKTSLVQRWCEGGFSSVTASTVRTDSSRKPVTINGQSMTAIVFDTVGEERMRAFSAFAFHGTNAVVLCVDPLVNLEQFDSVVDFLKEIIAPDLPIVVVATKVDLWQNDEPNVGEKLNQLRERVTKKGLTVIEAFSASALNGFGVNDVFDTAAKAGYAFRMGEPIVKPPDPNDESKCHC